MTTDGDLGRCVHCHARWVAHSIPIVHTVDCPEATGLYPVDLEDMCCASCDIPLQPGDFYVHAPFVPDGNPHEGCDCVFVQAVCVGCGAQADP